MFNRHVCPPGMRMLSLAVFLAAVVTCGALASAGEPVGQAVPTLSAAAAGSGVKVDRVSVLAEWLEDPDTAVRRAAARGLGELRDKKAVPALVNTVKNDSDEGVRLAALGSLVMIGDLAAMPSYEAALKDKSEHVRQSAALALSGIWLESAHKALVDALKTDPSEKVRRSVAEALGNPGIMGRYTAHSWEEMELTESALIWALRSDKDFGVRTVSASMLGRFKSAKALGALLDAFGKDASQSVRAASADSLGQLDMDSAIGPLVDAALFESNEKVRSSALGALKYFDDPRVSDAAADALRSSSPIVRWQALDVLEERGAREYADKLRDMMTDEYETEGIRYKAREALQSMGLE